MEVQSSVFLLYQNTNLSILSSDKALKDIYELCTMLLYKCVALRNKNPDVKVE